MPGTRIITEMPKIALASEKVFELFGFPISNAITASWLTMLIFMVVAFLTKRRMKLVPEGIQNSVELVLETFYERVVEPRAGQRGRRFLPFAAAVFFFILLSNWLGALAPGFNSIGLIKHEGGFVPLLRSANSDLNTTLALALVTVVSSWAYGIKILGPGYFRKYLSVLGPIELFGELAKLASLSLRLFGNIFAGEVLLIVTAILLPYLVPLPFMVLELFVGLIQAYIFTSLILIYLTRATSHSISTSKH